MPPVGVWGKGIGSGEAAIVATSTPPIAASCLTVFQRGRGKVTNYGKMTPISQLANAVTWCNRTCLWRGSVLSLPEVMFAINYFFSFPFFDDVSAILCNFFTSRSSKTVLGWDSSSKTPVRFPNFLFLVVYRVKMFSSKGGKKETRNLCTVHHMWLPTQFSYIFWKTSNLILIFREQSVRPAPTCFTTHCWWNRRKITKIVVLFINNCLMLRSGHKCLTYSWKFIIDII